MDLKLYVNIGSIWEDIERIAWILQNNWESTTVSGAVSAEDKINVVIVSKKINSKVYTLTRILERNFWHMLDFSRSKIHFPTRYTIHPNYTSQQHI